LHLINQAKDAPDTKLISKRLAIKKFSDEFKDEFKKDEFK